MSEAQKRAYILAGNKLALNAGWNGEILAQELKALRIEVPRFDLGITGFTVPKIDILIEGSGRKKQPESADDWYLVRHSATLAAGHATI